MPNQLKNAILGTQDSSTEFLKSLKRQTLDIIYGKGKTETTFVNFADSDERQQFIKGIQNIRNNPGIVPITSTVKVFNTYDICNPLQFAATQAFPPGSAVANAISGFEGKVGDLLNTFKQFQFIQGNQNAEGVFGTPDPLSGEIPLIPFQVGQIVLVIPSDQPGGNISAAIHKGAQVTIKQVDDPKVGSKMIGNVLRSFPITAEDLGENNDGTFGVGYQIEVTSISPSDPPYIKDKNGNTQTDEDGDPVLRGFENFTIEFESNPATTDVRELATELNGLLTTLRELGIEDIKNDLAQLPDTIPFVAKLKSPFQKFVDLVEGVETGVSQVATEVGAVQTTLEGGLTGQQVIERVRIIKDIQEKILPFTNVSLFIEEKFKKQIGDVNNLLKDFIPFDAPLGPNGKPKFSLRLVVQTLVNFAKYIEGTITFILALLRTINQMIKIITIVLKVLKVVIKVVKAVIKALPAAFVPVGAIQLITEKIQYVDDAIDTAIKYLNILSKNIDGVIGSLTLIRKFLTVFIKELAKFAEKLDSCETFPDEDKDVIDTALRTSFTALQALLTVAPNKDVKSYQQAQAVTDLINSTDDDVTVITLEDGSLMVLPGSVYGFNKDGNIVFNGKLVSGATGVVFDDARGQDLRDLFAEGNQLRYYTYNKFDAANKGLLQAAEDAFFKLQKQVDPEDRFGNFVETYLGYVLKIQEERPIDKNDNKLTRRRGVALDSNERIVAGTELTFSTNLSTIIQELKFKLKRDVDAGIIGVNTSDKDPNEIDDDSAVEMARTTGANPIAISNIKAEQANRAAALPELEDNPDPTPIEGRVGNSSYSSLEDNTAASSKPNPSVKQRPLDTQKLVREPLNEFIQSNPSLAKISNTYSVLSGASSNQLSQILSQPGVEELSEDELIANLKESILSEMDPNPDKIKEVQNKTDQWYNGLKEKAKADYDRMVARTPGIARKILPSFEKYFNKIEEQELPKWIKLLLRQRYTETEVEYGISNNDIREEYRIKIDGTKVKVKRKRGKEKE
jgi:hypothetical protein